MKLSNYFQTISMCVITMHQLYRGTNGRIDRHRLILRIAITALRPYVLRAVKSAYIPISTAKLRITQFRCLLWCILEPSTSSHSRTIRYDTIGEFNVDSKAEYSAISSTRSQKKKIKQTTPVIKQVYRPDESKR